MLKLLVLLQIALMTYNVENLFDTNHDTLKNDYDFTPQSERKWTDKRYHRKIHNLWQVIASTGDELPVIIGLCEIENENVMKEIAEGAKYKRLGYGYIHYESPDERGIDVGLLYKKERFVPILTEQIKANIESTRDILYVCGKLDGNTLLHIIQVHAPSRRGGKSASEWKRVTVGKQIRELADSIFAIDPTAGIVIMGDFNDNPDDKTTSEIIKAKSSEQEHFYNGELYNLTWNGRSTGYADSGSYCFSNKWEQIDQIIVSGSLLNGTLKLKLSNHATIHNPKWLQDKKGHPRRTYLGTFYQGGVSDHFPVLVKAVK